MYCGNCFRDNALVGALRRQGHETLMVPLYLPMTLDESSTAGTTPTFFGGINVYLSQVSSWHRRAPSFLRDLLNSPKLLKWAAGKAAKTRAEDVGDLTHSMLRGEEGNQARELEEMIGWLQQLPRPDAIYLSNALLLGFARQLKTRLQTRVLCFLQSEETFLDSIAEPARTRCWETLRERAQDVDAWISPTHFFAERMAQRMALKPSTLHVVPNGISLEGYPTTPRPAPNPPVLGFFARMCPDKGLDAVVDAFIELRRRGTLPTLRLKVGGGCGPGDEKFVANQKQKLADAQLLQDTSFHPNVSRDEKIGFFAQCTVLSVPTRMSEAFGLYTIEAMAAGSPLVQPDVCGFREILEGTGGGVVYNAREPKGLANALESLLRDPARLASLSIQGHRSIHTRYSDAAMAAGVLEVTQRIVS